MPRSTFYRWQKRLRAEGKAGLVDRRPDPGVVWNRLRPCELESILAEALRQPDLGNVPRFPAAQVDFNCPKKYR